MSRRFQFSLRALLVVATATAIVAWLVTLISAGTVLALSVAAVALWSVSRRPLEGILVCAFLIIVATWFGIFVFGAMMDGY
jgi:hypothetical protein